MTDHLGRPDAPATPRVDPDEPLVLPADPDLPVPYTVAAAGWHRPNVETAAIEHLTAVVGPISARQLVDGLLAKGSNQDTAAKDTRTAGESTLPSAVLDLLTAIRDALDIPLPGVEDRDERRFCWLMDHRRSAVYSTLNAILDSPLTRVDDRDAAHIRRRTAETPVTYTVWEPPAPADGGEQA